jgi:hypothetical protein
MAFYFPLSSSRRTVRRGSVNESKNKFTLSGLVGKSLGEFFPRRDFVTQESGGFSWNISILSTSQIYLRRITKFNIIGGRVPPSNDLSM